MNKREKLKSPLNFSGKNVLSTEDGSQIVIDKPVTNVLMMNKRVELKPFELFKRKCAIHKDSFQLRPLTDIFDEHCASFMIFKWETKRVPKWKIIKELNEQ